MADDRIRFDFSSTPLSQAPKRAALRPHVFKVKFRMQAKGFEESSAKLRAVLDMSGATQSLFQAAVIRSVVANIRRRYLANLEKAVEMKVLQQGGEAVKYSPRKRFRDLKVKDALERTLEGLNEAQIAQDHERAEHLAARADKLQEKLVEQLSVSDRGHTLKPHFLSELAGHQFRRQLIALLAVLTDAGFVGTSATSTGGLEVGIAPLALLDRLQTPSATSALTGRTTGSRFTEFWRQVEFGTGVRRSAQKDKQNPGVFPASTWFYNPTKKYGLLLAGTEPMNFLLNNAGQFYPEDHEALTKQMTELLDQLLQASTR
jgi:hypothetical protein